MLQGKEGFADLVKEMHSQLRPTQKELANALGVSFASVNRWENGRTTSSQLAQNQVRAFHRRKVARGLLHPGINLGA